MDAKIWTVGATLFTLLYLTLAISLVWSAVVVALLLAAWVMGMETEGPEGLKFVELEMRPALAFVGIFSLAVVVLGPHFPYVIGRSLYPLQYSSPMAVLRATPVLFYFPALPLVTGSVMTIHQRFHPLQGLVYQTAPSPSSGVHVHLHTARASRAKDDDDREDSDDRDTEAAPPKKSRHHPHLHHHLRRPAKVHVVADDEGDDDGEEDEAEEAPAKHHHRRRPLAQGQQPAEL